MAATAMVFLFVAFLLFSAALFGVAWYVWAMPQQAASRTVEVRLRELRGASPHDFKRPSLLHPIEVQRFKDSFIFIYQIGLLSHAEVSF